MPVVYSDSTPIHTTAKKKLWFMDQKRVVLEGEAVVNQPGETLEADWVELDTVTNTLVAKGNCTVFTSKFRIRGEEMQMDLNSRKGTVINGAVMTERFLLTGQKINRVGPQRFVVERGEYTTCLDCPQSWAFEASHVDIEIEGYAFLTDVVMKVKGLPVTWMPFLAVPVKSKRQTGFLPPRFTIASTSDGFKYVQPFFWATSRSTDMTLAWGIYSKRGPRYEWEGRYKLAENSEAIANFFYLRDREFPLTKWRWGGSLSQVQKLPFGLMQRLRVTEVSDNIFTTDFGDIPGGTEAYLSSEVIVNSNSRHFGFSVSGKRLRNQFYAEPLLDREGNVVYKNDDRIEAKPDFRPFDIATVQMGPRLVIHTNDKIIPMSPFRATLQAEGVRFTRPAGPFDFDEIPAIQESPAPRTSDFFTPGVDPIREVKRFSVNPKVYAAFRPLDIFGFVPSAELRYFRYDFPALAQENGKVNDLKRRFVTLQADLHTQIERIYETDSPGYPRVKHLFRPMLRYSLIPRGSIKEDVSHPFLKQIRYAESNGLSGYQFDNYDIVPIDVNSAQADYFVPIGNSLAYGFITKWIRRKGRIKDEGASYRTIASWGATQSINIRELRRTHDLNTRRREPFSRLYSDLNFDFERFQSLSEYYFYPYRNRVAQHNFATQMTYIIERANHQRTLAFDRSFSLGFARLYPSSGRTTELRGSFNYSLNDYLLPYASTSYNLITEKVNYANFGLHLQNPSQCWKIVLDVKFMRRDDRKAWDFGGIQLALNFTGDGYANFGTFTGGEQNFEATR